MEILKTLKLQIAGIKHHVYANLVTCHQKQTSISLF